MKRREALETIGGLRPQLTALGVRSLSVFGSVARDEADDASDLDLLVEFDRPVGLFHFVRVRDFLRRELGVPVDLVTPDALGPDLRESVLREAVHTTDFGNTLRVRSERSRNSVHETHSVRR